MNNQTVDPKNDQERDTLFNQIFGSVVPADKKQPTIVDKLMVYRKQIVAKRKEGYSLRQIADGIRTSSLKINASPGTIAVVIGGAAAKRRAKIRRIARLRAKNVAAAKQPAQPANTVVAAPFVQPPRKL